VTRPGPTIEHSPCPLCGREGEPRYDFAPYVVSACAGCDVLYLSERLPAAEMRRFYEDAAYFETAYRGQYTSQERALTATYAKLLRTIHRVAPLRGSLLEVGSGPGYFLREAARYFDHLSAIEFSPGAREQLARLGVTTYDAALDELGFEDRFDCLAATQVIEHVYEPRAFLRTMNRALRRGGTLILTTPDASSWARPLLGHRWPSFKAPEHVVLYTKRSLGRVLLDAGFADVRFVAHPHAFPVQLVADRLGLRARLPGRIGGGLLWIPGTSLAVVARAR
jgi:SAM-dependent methyltransferase